MTVLFKPVAKINPRDVSADPLYYAAAIRKEIVDIDQLCELISSNSTMSRSDVYGVVLELLDKIHYVLKEGRTVRLNKLGMFNLSLKSEGVEEAEKLTSHNIKGAKINFRPEKELKNMLATLIYEKIN
ncbi:MAG: HU family DNA-binding protein [Carboxylicivirga sp.]|jgi:predicted histone-like DNA-binding protein|nr:HU family DNA-binding protein [Carboxylicivirga sp.]